MIGLVRGADDTVAAWVALQLGFTRGFGPCVAMGVANDSGLIGGVVFHNWSPEAGVIEMTAASTDPRWLNREVLREVFGYAFGKAGCQLVVWQVSEHNARTRRLAERLGFEGHTIPRLRGRDDDGIVFTLTAETWSAGKYGKAA